MASEWVRNAARRLPCSGFATTLQRYNFFLNWQWVGVKKIEKSKIFRCCAPRFWGYNVANHQLQCHSLTISASQNGSLYVTCCGMERKPTGGSLMWVSGGVKFSSLNFGHWTFTVCVYLSQENLIIIIIIYYYYNNKIIIISLFLSLNRVGKNLNVQSSKFKVQTF